MKNKSNEARIEMAKEYHLIYDKVIKLAADLGYETIIYKELKQFNHIGKLMTTKVSNLNDKLDAANHSLDLLERLTKIRNNN